MPTVRRPAIVYAREAFAAAYPDLAHLMAANHAEVSPVRDRPLRLNRDAYQMIDEAGLLRLFVARVDETAVAYWMLHVRPHLHTGDLVATADGLYVDPAWRARGIAEELMAAAADDMRADGVRIVVASASAELPQDAWLTRQGYWLAETCWRRDL